MRKDNKNSSRGIFDRISSGRIFTGLLFIGIGIIFFLTMTGMITYPIVDFLKGYWPIFIILAGIAIICKAGFMAFLLVLTGLIFACTAQIPSMNSQISGDATTYAITDIPDELKSVDIAISYGAGAIRLRDSDNASVVTKTSPDSGNGFKYSADKSDVGYSIDVSGNENRHGFGSNNYLQINLPQEKEYSLDLNYGAANADFDLSRISVKDFNLDCGAAATKIKFGRYPTKGEINTGASSLELEFPNDYNVVVNVEGLVFVSDSNGFNKKGNDYIHEYSSADDSETIVINIDAGITDVKLSVYQE